MNPNTGYIIGIVILAVVAGVLGTMWFITNQNYNTLQAQYAGLQSMYNSLKGNYSSLESQYNNLLAMYAKLNSNYSQLLSNYQNLQGQYNSLQGQYQQLQSKYKNLANAFSNAESYVDKEYVDPGGALMYPIVVPSGYTATVSIYISSSDYIGVFVVTVSDMNTAMSVVPARTSTILYTWSGYTISQQITLQPGVYVIGVSNYLTNTAGAYITVQITTSLSG